MASSPVVNSNERIGSKLLNFLGIFKIDNIAENLDSKWLATVDNFLRTTQRCYDVRHLYIDQCIELLLVFRIRFVDDKIYTEWFIGRGFDGIDRSTTFFIGPIVQSRERSADAAVQSGDGH